MLAYVFGGALFLALPGVVWLRWKFQARREVRERQRREQVALITKRISSSPEVRLRPIVIRLGDGSTAEPTA